MMGSPVLSFDRRTSEIVDCTTRQDIRGVIDTAGTDRLWVSFTNAATSDIIETLIEFAVDRRGTYIPFGDLIMFEPPPKKEPVVSGLFGRVIGDSPGYRWLPKDQFREVLSAPNDEKRDLIIGGVVGASKGLVVFVRGNEETITVPRSMFRPSAKVKPQFRKFELDDYGRTLRFGDYEATTDVVLWEVDPDYRKRAKARERAQAEGFGPSLRRLRLQRGLSQSDFPGIDRKTISRIENCEVEKPHDETLHILASTLGVAEGEIESY